MLHSLIAYSRGAGVDARWVVIEGDPEFFRVTKRLHNRLHGAEGDGGPLGDDERRRTTRPPRLGTCAHWRNWSGPGTSPSSTTRRPPVSPARWETGVSA